MIRYSKVLILAAMAIFAAAPVLANAPPKYPTKRPDANNVVKPLTPAARVQMMQQRVTAARANASQSQAAYFGAIQALRSLQRQHAPLLRERNRQKAAFEAEAKSINQAIIDKRPGIRAMQADWNARKAAYDANVKAPAVKALEQIAAAEKNVVLKKWEFKSATDSVADAVGDRSRARVAQAQDAADMRALARSFPAAPSETQPIAGRTPAPQSATDKAAQAKAVVERAKANAAARNAAAAADAANASTSAIPVAPSGAASNLSSASRPRGPAHPVWGKLPAAPVVQYEQLPPPYASVPPGTQRTEPN